MSPRDMYLSLMRKVLLGLIYEDPPCDPWAGDKFDPHLRQIGCDWPSQAHSMIGVKRMENLDVLMWTVLRQGIPGDFIETGAWRGGACIYMRAMLKAFGVNDRRVFVADSFEGLPKPEPDRYPGRDVNDAHHTYSALAVSLEEVKHNFEKYDLLDDQVVFLKGWFKDTLPTAPIERIAILRMDGDMYSSTMDTFNALYDKVSPGGFIIVDDFALPGCNAAVADFRRKRDIIEPLVNIDGNGAFWMKVVQ